MNKVHTIDLNFQQNAEAIASYLVESSAGPILIESGPESTFANLETQLEKIGFKLEDIKHVFLTHIHFDHAGAAWKFAEKGAKIYVHPLGLPHLNSPEKLWNSAKQIYGDQMEILWGQMQPIPLDQLIPVDEGDEFEIGDLKIKALYTPGHAVHHNAYRIGDYIFTGDVAGVKIENGPVVPPCPPPDINIELWKKSIEKLRAEKVKGFYLTHFGFQENLDAHLDELSLILDEWASYMKPFFDDQTPAEEIVPKFMRFTQSQMEKLGLSVHLMESYHAANPAWMSVNGLLRYWKLKSQGRI